MPRNLSEIRCQLCHGSGRKPGTCKRCYPCDGRGKVWVSQDQAFAVEISQSPFHVGMRAWGKQGT
jgi:DnaJ-class molecular chaperone